MRIAKLGLLLVFAVLRAGAATVGNRVERGAPAAQYGLDQLRATGIAVVPQAEFMSPQAEMAFNNSWRRNLTPVKGRDVSHYLFEAGPKGKKPDWSTKSTLIRESLERLTSKLQAALPGEDFYLDGAQIQVSELKRPRASKAHIDCNDRYHLVVTFPLLRRGKSTILYKTNRSITRVETIVPGPRTAAVFGGAGRELVYKRPSIIHVAPPVKVKRRPVLIVTYLTRNAPRSSRFPKGTVKEFERRSKKLIGVLQRAATSTSGN